jgi:hypothetical protein
MAVIQGETVLGICYSKDGGKEGDQTVKKEKNWREAMLLRELKKNYYSLYGKMGFSDDGLSIQAMKFK